MPTFPLCLCSILLAIVGAHSILVTTSPPPTYPPCKCVYFALCILQLCFAVCFYLYEFGLGGSFKASLLLLSLPFSGDLNCQNNGSCVFYSSDFLGAYCYCPTNYTGELCQTRELESLMLRIRWYCNED